MTNYNGWTNYATWRINLEIFDGIDPSEMGWHKLDNIDLARALETYAHEILEMNAREGLALDYARAFLADVNWHEIADAMRDAFADDFATDDAELT
jgi:hypothetical protein